MPEAIVQSEEVLIRSWEEFLRKYYKARLNEVAIDYPQQRSLTVSYWDLDRHSPQLAELLLERPTQVLFAAEKAVQAIDVPLQEPPKLHIRVEKLPAEHAGIKVRELRATHLGRLIAIEGLVKRATDVRPRIEDALFRCLRCDALVQEPQDEHLVLKEPLQCYEDQGGCGHSTGFKLTTEKSRFVDSQKLEVQESPDALRGGEQPQRLSLFVEDDLCGLVSPGDRIVANGILRTTPKKQGNTKSTLFEIHLQVVSIEVQHQAYEELDITPEDQVEIARLAKDPAVYDLLVRSMAPTIFGMETEKEALVLQLFGGVEKKMPDSTHIRGDIHVLMVGDPGVAKCVTGDTEVVLADGRLQKIRELVESSHREGARTGTVRDVSDGSCAPASVPILALDQHGKLKPGVADLAWKRSAPAKLVRVRTASGREVTVTPTHPFFIWEEGIRGCPAQMLRPGDRIAAPRVLPIEGKPQDLVCVPFRASRSPNARRLRLPSTTSPEFWRFIGLLLGDGHVQLRQNGGTVYFTNNAQELLDEVQSFAESLGMKATVRSSHPGKTAREVVIPGVELASFLAALGLAEGSPKRRVPEILFRCSRAEISAFVGGLFDAEGTVSNKNREAVFSSASRPLLVEVQHLLLRLGIPSGLRSFYLSSRHRDYYRLRLGGAAVLAFAAAVPLRHQAKMRRLEDLGRSPAKLNTNLDVVPVQATTFERLRVQLRLRQADMGVPRGTYLHYARGDEHPSRQALSAVSSAVEHRMMGLQGIHAALGGQVPSSWADVHRLRENLGISQQELAVAMGSSQGLVSRYERGSLRGRRGKHSLSRASEALRRVVGSMVTGDALLRIGDLGALAVSDLWWDRVEQVEEVDPAEPWVYDLQVHGVHNFVANGLLIHNSQLLRYAARISPRGIYTSGKSSTGAGLTAAAVRDEVEGRWTLEAGALVLADRGLAAIDEIDKMEDNDRSAMHEALEQGTVSVAKAGITASLNSRCSVLGAANPKDGRFDTKYGSIAEQIDMPPTLLSRFDVIFPITDKPHAEKDSLLAKHILGVHRAGEIREYRNHHGEQGLFSASDEEGAMVRVKPPIEPELLRKFVAVAKRECYPVLTAEAQERIRTYYVDLRKQAGAEEGGPIPLTPRQLEALVRMTEASAKVRLSNEAALEDVERAIRIVEYYLRKVAGAEGGLFDIDKIASGVSHTQRDRIHRLLNLVEDLSRAHEDGAHVDDILARAREQGMSDEEVRETLERLHRDGRLLEPKPGRFKLLRR